MRPLKEAKSGISLKAAKCFSLLEAHQHLVELQHEVLQRHLPVSLDAEQVLEVLERPLQQVGVLDHAAVASHQRPCGSSSDEVVQRGRQVPWLRSAVTWR